ncbi:MAG: hypothetical protein C5B48_16425 [Candidatus Rokuibacteriota bacterium]|nr:MAG: hypothetical protein C5B48_16425 [Candidatus Rokubacteria bacterium]
MGVEGLGGAGRPEPARGGAGAQRGRAMTWRVTPLGLSLLTVAAWALSLGVLSARAELYVAAVPLVLALATLARRPSTPDYSLSHHLSADRVFEGDTLTVTVTVTAKSPIPIMELMEPLPRSTRVASGENRAVAALEPGQAASFSYEARCPVRGVLQFGTLAARVGDRWGVWAWEARHVDPKLVRVYPRIAPLRSLPRPLHTQTSVGDYVSPALGEGIEPGDIRQFAPGDRIKQVNWRASLRLGTLYVTQHHREKNADVVLMLDTLAQVGAAHDTTLDLGVRAAASLAAAYLGRKDRVGLIHYGGVINWVRPGSGRVQYERLADTLLRADVSFTYVTRDLALVPPRVLPPRALVIALTSLLDPRFTKATLDLAARGFDLVILVVSPVEVMRVTLPRSATNDLACRLWNLDRRAQLDEFRRHGLRVVEWNPSESLELALARLGRGRPRLARVG